MFQCIPAHHRKKKKKENLAVLSHNTSPLAFPRKEEHRSSEIAQMKSKLKIFNEKVRLNGEFKQPVNTNCSRPSGQMYE